MKMDLGLIRDILLHIEEHASFNDPIFSERLDLKAVHSDQTVYGHILLLQDNDFIVAEVERYCGNDVPHLNVERLSADGHAYLNSVRDPKIWRETKLKLDKIGGSVGLAITQELALSIVKKTLGL